MFSPKDQSSSSPLILGFDIDDTITAVVLGTFEAEILFRKALSTDANMSFDATFEEIIRKANNLLAEAKELGYSEPDAIFVSIGGSLDIESGIIHAPIHLPNWNNIHLKDFLSDIFKIPVYIVPPLFEKKTRDMSALLSVIHHHETQRNILFDDSANMHVVISALQAGIDVRMKTISTLPPLIYQTANQIIKVLQDGGKVLLCGNGGSAATAQHLAGELCGRYLAERRPLAAIALTADSSVLTCIGNDYEFQDVFSRQITALGRPGDILIAFTTSGKSPNIINAIRTAKKRKLWTVSLTGDKGLQGFIADFILAVPSKITARIQEEHDAIIHAICDLIDIYFSEE